MAGWSKIAVDDEKRVNSCRKIGNGFDIEPGLESSSVKIEKTHEQQDDDDDDDNNKNLKSLFAEFLTSFYEEFYGPFVLRPLPPMLGDGQSVDLLKLYLTVREKGGYFEVSEKRLWDSVAEECGFDSRFVSELKLVYAKYLDLLEKWLQTIGKNRDLKSGVVEQVSNFGEASMDLELRLKGMLGKFLNKKKMDGECLNLELKNELNLELKSELNLELKSELNLELNSELNLELKSELNCSSDGEEICNQDKHFGVLEPNGDNTNVEEKRVSENGNEGGFENVEVNISVDNNDVGIVETLKSYDVVKEKESGRKRKRECYSGVIEWITEVAKDPCDPGIGLVPERSRWRCYGNEHLWKQVLLVREALLLRKNADSTTLQSIWQNKQMHPAMYEDFSISERLRCSRRLLSAKEPVNKSPEGSSSSAIDEDLNDKTSDSSADSKSGLWVLSYRKKRVPLGQNHQTYVPEWNGKIQESESKWVGSRIWPVDIGERNKHLIERERIGKGRQDTCGCPSPGSVQCVKFHVAEKRTRMKLELGTAFYMLKFNNMGEEVAVSWTKDEETKFQDIVKSNPYSLGKRFWEELFKCFPGKDRETLVRYYFNVFLLRRRANQNRIDPSNVDSDDDETDPPEGSAFSSPKKVHLNFR